ncbi:MAG: LysR family transcriptional regulator [Rickettsiales bacterium]|nr:LysR family transcriptional regulator [Rickettsiales bacterium]
MKEEKFYQVFYKSNIIQPLKGFCTAVEEGCSLARAGEKLYLSTTAIFKQIHSLEEKLNVKLFRKAPNGTKGTRLELTEEGQDFYEKVKEIVEKTDRILSEYIDDKNCKNDRTLKLALNPCIFQKLINYINDFKKRYNDLDLKIFLKGTNDGINAILNNESNIFFSSIEVGEKVPPKVKFVEFTKYKPYLVLYKDHSLKNKKSNEITMLDLLKNEFIFDDKIISMNSLRKFIDNNNIKTSINIDDCNIDTIKMLIKNEMCIFFIFDVFLNENDKNDFIFKDLKNFFPNGSYGCFVNKNYTQKKILKEFIDFLESKKEEIYKDRIHLDNII